MDLLLDWWLFQSKFLLITSGSGGDFLIQVCKVLLSTFFELVIYSNFGDCKWKKPAEERKNRDTWTSRSSCPFPGMVPRTGTFLLLALPFSLSHPGIGDKSEQSPQQAEEAMIIGFFHTFLEKERLDEGRKKERSSWRL